jgi:hypothetical protein
MPARLAGCVPNLSEPIGWEQDTPAAVPLEEIDDNISLRAALSA